MVGRSSLRCDGRFRLYLGDRARPLELWTTVGPIRKLTAPTKNEVGRTRTVLPPREGLFLLDRTVRPSIHPSADAAAEQRHSHSLYLWRSHVVCFRATVIIPKRRARRFVIDFRSWCEKNRLPPSLRCQSMQKGIDAEQTMNPQHSSGEGPTRRPLVKGTPY